MDKYLSQMDFKKYNFYLLTKWDAFKCVSIITQLYTNYNTYINTIFYFQGTLGYTQVTLCFTNEYTFTFCYTCFQTSDAIFLMGHFLKDLVENNCVNNRDSFPITMISAHRQ